MNSKSLSDLAIKAALKQDWHQAIELNLEILDQDPFHIPTLNRLARAYKETGQSKRAISIYEQVLKIDRFNDIARKNLHTLCNGHVSQANNNICHIDTNFIDEPGRTKTLPLTRLGDPRLLSSLQPGQEVKLVVKNHFICVANESGEHIGALTDDIAYHLRQFIKAGNTYHTVIKSVNGTKISIFIRELNRADAFKNAPTFSAN
jgi:tetratricopeptide (TPR) repeat protein